MQKKRVRGKEYYYHRITQNRKRSEVYLNFDEVEPLRAKIEKRKALEAELKELKHQLPKPKKIQNNSDAHKFNTYVRIQEQLKNYATQVKQYKKRECYKQLDRVMSSIMGEMLEELILLETKIANPKKQVFQLQFDRGEFDMVIYDPSSLSCEIFEIKHNEKVYPDQYVHLIDEKKCEKTEHRFGTIKGKYVIYRSEPQEVDGIQYLNAEEYLNSLGKKSPHNMV